jgi:hypothetical protein
MVDATSISAGSLPIGSFWCKPVINTKKPKIIASKITLKTKLPNKSISNPRSLPNPNRDRTGNAGSATIPMERQKIIL